MTNPKCKYCGVPLLRWGWYFDPEHPVYYYYALCCDMKYHYGYPTKPWENGLGNYIVVLEKGATEG